MMSRKFTIGTASLIVLLPSLALHGLSSPQDPIDPVPVTWCCQPSAVDDGPEAEGCSASCSEGGVPLSSPACSLAGQSSGPYVHPGGCLQSTDPEATCSSTTWGPGELPLFWCRRYSCVEGRYECQWEVDGSTFTWSMSDCTGTNCYDG